MTTKQIYTVGYEGINFPDFVDRLKSADVDVLVDVRQMPVSRKKGFSKRRLAEWLAEEGIGYEHFVSLGCPKSIRDRYRLDKNWSCYELDYVSWLQAERASEVLRLSEFASLQNCALMCFEADYNRCHRSLISRELAQVHGFSEVHIGCVRTAIAA